MPSDRNKLSHSPATTTLRTPHVRVANTRRLASITVRVLCFIILLACAAHGQSGRRQPKHEEIPPVPTPTPLPQATKPKQEALKKIPVLVLIDASLSADTSASARDIVTQSFGQRLREANSFDISADSSSRTTRGEAQRRAKNEQERFVVWMMLRSNGMGNDPMSLGRPNPENYHIEYAVFDPTTGKTRSAGSVYMRAGYGSIGGIAVGVPRCYPAVYAYEYEFVVGAIDAADRVMKAFELPLPPVCGG